MWDWLTKTNAGLATRIGVGATIFFILALRDIRAKGLAKATRWREYLFLIFCVSAAMVYGIINDLITSTISWEYFYYGKELEKPLGPVTPPDSTALHLAAMVVGMKATWTVGLLVGAILLIANNPRKNQAQVPYGTLVRLLGMIAVIAIAASVILGIAGSMGGLNWISSEFPGMFSMNLMRPARFIGVFGIHLGGYFGGLLGLVASIALIFRIRARDSSAAPPDLSNAVKPLPKRSDLPYTHGDA